MTEASSELFDVICDVLRTDLKLGSVELTMETPLVGDELGLDSLDLLMVVTGTEKRLGIKKKARLGACALHSRLNTKEAVIKPSSTSTTRAGRSHRPRARISSGKSK